MDDFIHALMLLILACLIILGTASYFLKDYPFKGDCEHIGEMKNE